MALNKQEPGIEWTHPYGRPGYTWNPVQGCKHDCKWTMPDGKIAECYAGGIARKFQRPGFFERGFEEHYYHPAKLKEPLGLNQPAGIFLDSMSDLMGSWVPEAEIRAVLDICARTPQHIYFLLTKNAPRLLKFEYPENVWVGASSPPDFMHGKKLTREQQAKMLDIILRTLNGIDVSVRWISFEPLSWDVSAIVSQAKVLQWAVIGAASNGAKEFPPEEAHLKALLNVLDTQKVPVFYKGNLRSLPYAKANWRENYPAEHKQPVQLNMFAADALNAAPVTDEGG